MFIGKVLNAHAETAKFYEAEYIDNIYMSKYQYSTRTTYYQKARFFKKTGTNEIAYCIEPFTMFSQSQSYESTDLPSNLNKDQVDRISKIAYFGYGYKNHTAAKWYAVTQMMIWQASSNDGDFFFTDTLNGNKTTAFQDEINEINSLVNNYKSLPSFTDQTYTIVENQTIEIEDKNNILSFYKSNDKEIEIINNKIKISNLKAGKYSYTLTRNDTAYNTPLLFYQTQNSQNIVKTGNLQNLDIKLNINVIKTRLDISKIDKDTKSTTPSGEAILDGAIYKLYDENNKEIAKLIIKDNQASIDNLPFGKYYLKEVEAGIGYTIDDKTYEINITETSSKINIILENKVIKKKIRIEKKYGEGNIFQSEKNITFHVFNSKNELITTITTNDDGIAEITLPYGEYTLVQLNTTEGYKKVDPITIKITDDEDELIELKDMRIPVPDTHTEDDTNNFLRIIYLIIGILF